MPTNHRGKQRIPLDLEPALLDDLVATSNKLGIKRTVLARIFIKYGLNHLEEAIEFGDKIVWKPKTTDPSTNPPNSRPNPPPQYYRGTPLTNEFGDPTNFRDQQ